MCVGSIPSFPSVFFFSLSHLSSTFGTFGVIQNHPISIPPSALLFLSSLTPLSSSSPFVSILIALPCGRVTVSSPLCALPLPPLPFLVKERMRLEREEATRLLEEETEVRHSSSAGPGMNFLSVQNCTLDTNTKN